MQSFKAFITLFFVNILCCILAPVKIVTGLKAIALGSSQVRVMWEVRVIIHRHHSSSSECCGRVHWTRVLALSECGFEIRPWPVAALVSLSKTLNHNCFVLQMGRKAVGPMCCVMHVKEPRTLIVKEKRLALVFLDSRLEHPAGWICARYKSYHYHYHYHYA